MVFATVNKNIYPKTKSVNINFENFVKKNYFFYGLPRFARNDGEDFARHQRHCEERLRRDAAIYLSAMTKDLRALDGDEGDVVGLFVFKDVGVFCDVRVGELLLFFFFLS